jgi:putative hemolysin
MIIFFVLCLIVLLFFSAYLSASETSLFSLSHFTLKTYRHDQDNRKKLIAHLLERPRELLVTIIMLNICCNVLVQNVVSGLFGNFSSWLIKVGIPLILTLIFGEVIPKSIALPNNTKIAYRVSPFIAFSERVLGPVRIAFTKITSFVSRFMFFFLKKEAPISIEELDHVLKTGRETNILQKDEAELIKGYLELHSSFVKEKMRPRDEVVYYDIESDKKDISSLFIEKKCSKIPVCKDGLENILGILSAKTYFVIKDELRDFSQIEKYLKKPFFTPETTNSWNLLHEMRAKNEDISIIVDEYGSISGLITQEDLFESIIGEIEDIKDVKKRYTRSGKDVIIASGKMEIDEFEDLFEVTLQSKTHAVTLGGWLIEQFEDIPSIGTKLEKQGFLFYILAADPHRIRRIYIRRIKNKKAKL